jgi:hypothetical protein
MNIQKVEGDLDCHGLVFPCGFNVKGCIFTGHVNFAGARFERNLVMKECVFERGLTMTDAVVEGSVYMDRSQIFGEDTDIKKRESLLQSMNDWYEDQEDLKELREQWVIDFDAVLKAVNIIRGSQLHILVDEYTGNSTHAENETIISRYRSMLRRCSFDFLYQNPRIIEKIPQLVSVPPGAID